MNELRVNLDPLNPGQFFACCGLLAILEAAKVRTRSKFEIGDTARCAQFLISGDKFDLRGELEELRLGQVEAAQNTPVKVEASIEAVTVKTNNREWLFDWWLTDFGDESIELKCWAGQVKSAVLAKELFSLLDAGTDSTELFNFAVMTKAKFGIDPRSAWNALDFGYSPNEHGKDAATYPMVEVLGCIGLQSFRPTVLKGRRVRYTLWKDELPCTVARLAAFMPWSGLEHRNYEFSIDKRGQSYKFFSFSKFLGEAGKADED